MMIRRGWTQAYRRYLMPKMDKADRRDKQREKKRRGMKVVGKSLEAIMNAIRKRGQSK